MMREEWKCHQCIRIDLTAKDPENMIACDVCDKLIGITGSTEIQGPMAATCLALFFSHRNVSELKHSLTVTGPV